MRIVLFFMILGVFSCKRDKLDGRNEVLIGNWVWQSSSHVYGWCDGDSFYETLSPESEGNSFTMEFIEKGKVTFFSDNVELGKKRIVFTEFNGNPCDFLENAFTFSINLNNDDKNRYNRFRGCVNADSMIVTHGFPYEIYEEGCESYSSVFVKE